LYKFAHSAAGLYILASEPVKIPWFDAVYADIGDEQSLTQSLSTFSGHLKQIGVCLTFIIIKFLLVLNPNSLGPYLLKIFISSAPEPSFYQAIRAQSTSQSLVLLDEVSTYPMS
jgi:dsDNA-specific endonuclease/ATPase MutS2